MEATFEQLYEAAKGRIRETVALEAHEDRLLDAEGVDRGTSVEEHYRWLANAPEAEILHWLEENAPTDLGAPQR